MATIRRQATHIVVPGARPFLTYNDKKNKQCFIVESRERRFFLFFTRSVQSKREFDSFALGEALRRRAVLTSVWFEERWRIRPVASIDRAT